MKLICICFILISSIFNYQSDSFQGVELELKIRDLIDNSKIDELMFSDRIIFKGFENTKNTKVREERYNNVKKELQFLFNKTDYIVKIENNKVFILNHSEKVILYFNEDFKLYKLEKEHFKRSKGAPDRSDISPKQ